MKNYVSKIRITIGGATSAAIAILLIVNTVFTHNASAATIVAWGDSLTFGTGAIDYGKKSYRTWFSELSGATVINKGVGGESSTQIRDRLIAPEAEELRKEFTIIWAGNNNPDATDKWVQRHIAQMIAALGHDNYLIIGVINRSTAPKDSTTWNNINIINADLKTTYGTRFVDVRPLLVSSYNPSIAQDVIDHENDVIPNSLRNDNIHLTTEGYRIVAQAVYSAYLTVIPEPKAYALLVSFLLIPVSLLRLKRIKRVRHDS